MKKYKIIVEYDGTHYFGWQYQKNGPTIQGELEKALWRMFQENIQIMGSGRTDRGVHAEGQVAHFTTSKNIPLRNIIFGLNSLLPWDISVKNAEEVSLDFHATLSTKSKIYRYTILNQPVRSAVFYPYAKWVVENLDVEKMKQGAQYLLGTHDFRSFETVNSPRKSTVRTVMNLSVESCIQKGSRLIEIHVEADGFLYNMVRSISGTLIEVGRGKIDPRQMEEILHSRDRKRAGPTAEARGLCLVEVKY